MQIKRWSLLSVLLVLLSFSGGCATYVAHVAPGIDASQPHRFFVVRNLDDNHRIDVMIVDALKAEGKEAEYGPLTMVPSKVDAVIGYRDHWSWDFTDHLVTLSMEMRDPVTGNGLASATYVSPTSLRTPAESVVYKLVGEMLHQKGRPLPKKAK
ncbi:hypothetical protein GALL_52710 [mine drainage metagenome]|uniref:Lipoprotein n=1 Tax=mine drainage metagenome TaxID=410659 RepID=A0A1J5SY95_9ZZZZ